MIELRPFEDLAAMVVFNRLDPHDRMEAELIRGAAITQLGLFADWRAVQPNAVTSLVAVGSGRPFALFMLSNTGQAGVAEAALLAADHKRHRRDLGRLLVTLRDNMAVFCAERGIHRIEARAWADHPTASGLLAALGFTMEAEMPGFGQSGRIRFRQFAWIDPGLTGPVTQKGENHVSG